MGWTNPVIYHGKNFLEIPAIFQALSFNFLTEKSGIFEKINQVHPFSKIIS